MDEGDYPYNPIDVFEYREVTQACKCLLSLTNVDDLAVENTRLCRSVTTRLWILTSNCRSLMAVTVRRHVLSQRRWASSLLFILSVQLRLSTHLAKRDRE